MGLDLIGLRALLFARRACSVDLRNTVTLGRHASYLTSADLRAARRLGLSEADCASLAYGSYIEPQLRSLGAVVVETLDASDWEGASIVWDFNRPVPAGLTGQFTAYLDFGSMEHVFNVPQVIANANALLQAGGSAVILTDANGNAGHGFYQYSPEFFFSAFSEANGFGDTRVFLVDKFRPATWIAVKSPMEVGRRVKVPNRRFFILCITCKRSTADVVSAQQSDYVSRWNRAAPSKTVRREKPLRTALRRVIPSLAKWREAWTTALRFRRHSRRFNPDDVAGPSAT